MLRQNYLFTSESVSEGHPDKVCDRISDEIVDLVYREAKKSGMDPWKVRVACETLATTNRVIIAGEVRVPDTLLKKDRDGNVLRDAAGHPKVNPSKFKSVARRAIRDIGYEQAGFHWKKVKIDVLLHGQSPDIGQGVDNAADRQGEEGAGDQGAAGRLSLRAERRGGRCEGEGTQGGVSHDRSRCERVGWTDRCSRTAEPAASFQPGSPRPCPGACDSRVPAHDEGGTSLR